MNWSHWKKPDHLAFIFVGVFMLTAFISIGVDWRVPALWFLIVAALFWLIAFVYDVEEEREKNFFKETQND